MILGRATDRFIGDEERIKALDFIIESIYKQVSLKFVRIKENNTTGQRYFEKQYFENACPLFSFIFNLIRCNLPLFFS